jgi:hypothetical protein
MTQPQPERLPASPESDEPGTLPDPLDLQQLIAFGDLDVVDGDPPVPISVWRIAGLDEPTRPGPTTAPSGLTPRLAALLVDAHTRRGDTIVDLTGDPAIAGAAGTGARRYLPIDGPGDLADLDHVAGSVRLVVLRWRRPDSGEATTAELTDLFVACRLLLAADGYTVVALAPIPPHTYYIEHARLLIPAAYRAGLGYLQHIVAVADARTYAPIHIDLLVFVLRGGRHG